MVTDQGIKIMTEDLGIAQVYDLRSQTEIDRDRAQHGRQVREWEGAERVFVPVFGSEDYSPEAIALRFSNFSREGSAVCSSFFSSLSNSLKRGPTCMLCLFMGFHGYLVSSCASYLIYRRKQQ